MANGTMMKIMLWRHVLQGAFGPPAPGPYVMAGDANLDPVDGSGIKAAISAAAK